MLPILVQLASLLCFWSVFCSASQRLSWSRVKSAYLNFGGSSGLAFSSRLIRSGAQVNPLRQTVTPFKGASAATGTLGPYSLSRRRLPLVTQPVQRMMAANNSRSGKAERKVPVDLDSAPYRRSCVVLICADDECRRPNCKVDFSADFTTGQGRPVEAYARF